MMEPGVNEKVSGPGIRFVFVLWSGSDMGKCPGIFSPSILFLFQHPGDCCASQKASCGDGNGKTLVLYPFMSVSLLPPSQGYWICFSPKTVGS